MIAKKNKMAGVETTKSEGKKKKENGEVQMRQKKKSRQAQRGLDSQTQTLFIVTFVSCAGQIIEGVNNEEFAQ